MLVLSRRLNEKILFPTIPAAIQVLAVKAGVVRLGIEAPAQVPVLREELRGQQVGSFPLPDADRASATAALRRQVEALSTSLMLLRDQLGQDPGPVVAGTLGHLEQHLRDLLGRLEGLGSGEGSAKARRALVVEDNPSERAILAQFLRGSGLEVSLAGDGADALESLHRLGRPDVVLLDMGLPRCDGATTVRVIRRDPAYAGLKIFAVTGHTPEEFDLHVGPEGVDRWFHKPVDPVELVRDVTRELEQPRRC